MLPLQGINVLDLSKYAPGPFCTMILGDLGANVLNIESPVQADTRFDTRWRIPTKGKKKEELYNSLNRNKKSMVINLKTKEGRDIFYKLADKTDVIVEGFRPGVVSRLGIGYKTISKRNPRVIYCSISGYGQEGPYSQLPGHDINYLSLSGALSLITDRDGNPIVPLNLLGDLAGGSLYATIGILTALYARKKTGKGQYIDINLTNGVMSLLMMFFNYYFLNGVQPEPGRGLSNGFYPYHGIYQTKDHKYITIGCMEPWFWEKFCRVIKREDFIPFHFVMDHMYEVEKEPKWSEISSSIKKIFKSKTRDEWFELLASKEIPVGKVLSLSEVLSDPHIKQQEMVIEINHPTEGKIRQVGFPIKFSKTKAKIRSASPCFAEHTKTTLKKVGYTQSKIEEFFQKGVVQ
jgi:crotonobetainyl-CoA:carnitine CoA-transferase CaiB-like acyl-CoA transferase